MPAYAEIANKASIVEDVLKTLGEPVRLRDIVDLTKDKVEWKSNSTEQIKTFMRNSPHIRKADKMGFYEYSESSKKTDDKIGQKKSTRENVTKDEQAIKMAQFIARSRDEERRKLAITEGNVQLEANIKAEPKILGNSKVNDDIVPVSESDMELLNSFRNETKPIMNFAKPKPSYKQGDVFEGVVTGVEEYGAFVEDEHGVHGLVHITNIRNGITDDVARHFKLGDRVISKVARNKNGKLSLSTKNFPLPDYFRNDELKRKLEPVAHKISEPIEKEVPKINPIPVNSPKMTLTSVEVKSEPKVEMKTESKIENKQNKEVSEELLQVYNFVQGITGVVSDNARDELKRLIEEKGMFKFMLALTDIARDFTIDVGMMFAKQVEEKMSECL